MAANITSENKGNPAYFVSSFLSKPTTSIPKGAQWAVFFNDLERTILPAIELAYKREPVGSNWKTQEAAAAILTQEYQSNKGCLFCQAIGLPGEGGNPVPAGDIKYGSLVRSHVGAGRNDYSAMRMTFLDTNVSFCDSFLRGWALATSAFGMVVRSGEFNYRTDLICVKFGITPVGPVILQQMSFQGLCCISVSEEEYNYREVTAPVEREAQFLYHSYQVETYTV